MSKTYIVSRNGETVTKAPINDNKIPIYANETALDADLANIPDNTLVATRGGHDDVIDQMKDYIRKQNVLSAFESITISTDSNNPTPVPYDGFILFQVTGNSREVAELSVYVNGTLIGMTRAASYASRDAEQCILLPVKKGDTVYASPVVSASQARFYKDRDYTGR